MFLGSGIGSINAADQFFAGDGSAFNSSKWGIDGGPYTSAFTSGNVANFNVANGTGTGASVTVGGILATENFTLTGIGGTISNASDGVVGINVSSGKILDFSTQGFTGSVTAGYTKNGDGVLALAGATYGAGFTLNAGTVILRGVNGMGDGGTLTINGGTIAANATRDLSSKYDAGIVIGGDFTLGATTGLATSSANLTFNNNVSLGSSIRAITIGGTGTYTLSGTISGSGGINVGATAAGTLALGTGNTYSGKTAVVGGTVSANGESAFGANPMAFVTDQITFNGSTLSASGNIEFSSNRGVTLGANGGTFDSSSGTITLTNVVAGSSGGSLTKTGTGTLVVAGLHTYDGATNIRQGTLQLTSGNNRIPIATTVSLGQASSANLGTLDLNGFSQQIAGLNSVTGTNNTASNNVVTSSTSATLTLAGSGTYSYGGGTNANSGVITGANLKLVKSGNGTQTLGDVNTYGGGTDIDGGTLAIANASALGTSGTISFGGGTLQYNSTTADLSSRFSTAASQAYSINTNGNNVEMAASLTSSGGTFTKSGAGILTFSGAANTYSGLTTVSGGTLALAKTAGTNSIAGDLTINGGTVNYTNANQITDTSNVTLSSGMFNLGTSAETINSLAMSGGSLNRQSGVLALSNPSSITGGALAFTSASASSITLGSTLALGGATFDLTSGSIASIDTLLLGGNVTYAANNIAAAAFTNSGGGTGRLALGGSTRTFDIADSETLGSGVAEVQVAWSVQNGGLTKSGTGKLTLSAANTYTGATTINGGILAVDGSLASGSAVTVHSEGTLGGSGTVNGTVTVKSGGVLSPGNSPGKLTTGSTTFEAGSIFEWDLNANKDTDGFDDDVGAATDNGVRDTDFDAVNGTGVLTVDNTANTGAIFRIVLGSGVNLADAFWSTPYITQTWSNIFSGFSSLSGGFNTSNIQVVGQSVSGMGSFTISGTSLTWTAVPEPTSALAGILLGIGLLRRRRAA
jgi:autotransporter-associated beta strand protein